MENKLRARALVNEWYSLALEHIADAELVRLVTRIAAALDTAERRGLQLAATAIDAVANEHTDQDSPVVGELRIAAGDIRALAEDIDLTTSMRNAHGALLDVAEAAEALAAAMDDSKLTGRPRPLTEHAARFRLNQALAHLSSVKL